MDQTEGGTREESKAHDRGVDPDYNCVVVEFTDGTAMSVDVLPAVSVRPQFQHVGSGDTKILRNYRAKINVAGN